MVVSLAEYLVVIGAATEGKISRPLSLPFPFLAANLGIFLVFQSSAACGIN
jgi:hypothetical protein